MILISSSGVTVPHEAAAEVSRRKPSGEIGCCQSRMAERLKDSLKLIAWKTCRCRQTVMNEIKWLGGRTDISECWWAILAQKPDGTEQLLRKLKISGGAANGLVSSMGRPSNLRNRRTGAHLLPCGG